MAIKWNSISDNIGAKRDMTDFTFTLTINYVGRSSERRVILSTTTTRASNALNASKANAFALINALINAS